MIRRVIPWLLFFSLLTSLSFSREPVIMPDTVSMAGEEEAFLCVSKEEREQKIYNGDSFRFTLDDSRIKLLDDKGCTVSTTGSFDPLDFACSFPGGNSVKIIYNGPDANWQTGEGFCAMVILKGIEGAEPGPCPMLFRYANSAGVEKRAQAKLAILRDASAEHNAAMEYVDETVGNLLCDLCRRNGLECDPALGCPKLVFVTSTVRKGNFGGLAVADTQCQQLAEAAGLPGNYKAWLSDSTTSARDRLTHASVPYIRVDGVKIADDWTDLTDGSLDAPIKLTELGVSVNTLAWTGTDEYGGKIGTNCSDWTTDEGDSRAGQTILTSQCWTNCVVPWCYVQLRFYCFQQ